jgi:cellulose synthase/poly-beta-1,6-N-acetylglucosamine synthase-like glycosyltransferase
MLMGPVRIKSNDTLFSKLQAVEFSSLIGSAAATLNLGFPIMCNGANLSYTKESFIEVNGFQGNEHIPSGDDEFLMRKIVKKFGAGSLRFLNDSNALVTTNPLLSLRDFLSQRIRWAGKWRYNSNALTRIIAVWVLMFHFSWLLAIGFIIFQPMNNTIAGLIVVKIALEGFFLFMISKFMRQKFSLSAFLLLQIFYPLYVITVGVFSNVIRASWKGRPIPN